MIDAPLVFAETGTGVLPCVNGPGRINPRREDGEGVSSRIRIRDEGLIGEMGSYGGDGYMGLPTDRPTRQEFTDPTSMVTTLDSECSGTYVIGGLEDFDFIVPRRDLQDACRRPTTPDTHSYGKSGASILLNIRIGRRPRHAMNVLLVMPTDRDGNAVSVSNESSSWYFRVLLWRKPSQRITSPEHASLTTLSMRLAVLMKDDRAHSTPQMANECSSYHRSSSGGQSLP